MAREEIGITQDAARAPRGPAREFHSSDVKIDQLPPITDPADYAGDIVLTDRVVDHDYAAELAFMEEPVTIRLEPSSAVNAANVFEVWVNGQGAEVLINGRWRSIVWLPVGEKITIKRKVLEVIARVKVGTVHTEILNPQGERPNNIIERRTSAVHAFSVLEDRNPRGIAWLSEIRRRNL